MTIADHIVHDGEDVRNLERLLLSSPILGPVFRQWSAISLPDCWLVFHVIADMNIPVEAVVENPAAQPVHIGDYEGKLIMVPWRKELDHGFSGQVRLARKDAK